ncbi:MAG: DNA polymerase III subunit alpha, partial [bacterium]
LLDDILKETFGIMCYQEDVAKVAMALGGFDAAEADDLRKILSKKRSHKRLEDYREKFYHGAHQRGVASRTIDQIWEMILSFSGYSFCKPHSASYALVSFESGYLRAHYPAEFMAAVISNQGGYYSTFAYISEARRMGLKIVLPDINKSQKEYTGYQRQLQVGFMQLKGLQSGAVDAILEERKRGLFRSFEDFLQRVDIDPADTKFLIKSGAFDRLEPQHTRPELMWKLIYWLHHHCRKSVGNMSLFEEIIPPMPRAANYDALTMLRHECETLGFLISRHPLTLYQKRLKNLNYVPAKSLHRHVGRTVNTIGWLVTGKIVHTKTNEPMEFISFEDTTALYETTFFPKAYAKFCHMLTSDRPYLLRGKVEEDFGAITLTVSDVRFL